jgi:glycosyltransferase involved in cell wall biosynthesis
MNPVVSICIPAYNAEAHLEELIEAVLRQSFNDWELIIVDNASTDSTAKILEKIRETYSDPRIKVFTNKHVLKMGDNFNVAIGQARGEFVKLICADDLPYRDCLSRQVDALRQHPSVVIAAGARVIINNSGRKLFPRRAINKTGIYHGGEVIRRCIVAGTNIIGDPVSVMWRRIAMEQVGVFDPKLIYCIDVEYWLRLLSVGDLFFDVKPLASYRIHKNATTAGVSRKIVEDFIYTAKLQIERKSVSLSKFQLGIVATKSWLQCIVRQKLYRLLG